MPKFKTKVKALVIMDTRDTESLTYDDNLFLFMFLSLPHSFCLSLSVRNAGVSNLQIVMGFGKMFW